GDWARAMPHVLTACHDPGHGFVLALHGTGDRHRLYLGGRRLVGAGGGSTEDYLAQQESSLKAYYTGLQMGPVTKLASEGPSPLYQFGQAAPTLAAITGIPAGRGGRAVLETQTLDRLVRAVGDQKYMLTIVAEPLDPLLLDQTLDLCRRLRGELHAYVKHTVS